MAAARDRAAAGGSRRGSSASAWPLAPMTASVVLSGHAPAAGYRALPALRPRVLILDEPMNGLDPAGILESRHMVRSLVARGPDRLLSSHLLDEVEKTCDSAAIVDGGRVMAQGTIAELTASGDPRDRHRRRRPP